MNLNELLIPTLVQNPSNYCTVTSNSQNVQVKITRLDENFFSDLKRKRKLSTDSLDSLSEELEKIEKPICSPNVEQFINESGLNVQLIAKNDKKLVKLNLNNRNPDVNLIESIKSIINKPQVSNVTASMSHNNSLNDIDDLPSESDVSSGVVLIPINQNPTTINQLIYKCSKCFKMFTDETLYKLHQDTQECLNSESENEFEKLFLNDSTESVQIQSDEDKSQPNKVTRKRIFICNECGYQFYLQSDFNKHMLQVHENVKPYQCSLCPMTFYEQSTKNRHEKEHSGLKPYRCYICAFEFTRASNLRTHLFKLHPNDVGKLVNITKSADNRLKFEFDLDAINFQREQNKLNKLGSYPLKSNSSSHCSLNSETSSPSPVANTVIYIKDPNNKNAEIQHMVVYVDGKPIFVQNPKLNSDDCSREAQVPKSSSRSNVKKLANTRQTKSTISNQTKPVAKIPYLLAVAAAAAASNHRKQQQLTNQIQTSQQYQNMLQTPTECIRTLDCSYSTNENVNKIKELKQDQEYMQLVSMFKQKNEKLYNPLKSF